MKEIYTVQYFFTWNLLDLVLSKYLTDPAEQKNNCHFILQRIFNIEWYLFTPQKGPKQHKIIVLFTSKSPVMFWNFCLWSVTCRELEINPMEIAADHWRCSCSCWNNQLNRNFEAVDLKVWADWGNTWK